MQEQAQIRRAELNQKLLEAKSGEAEQKALFQKYQEELEQVCGKILDLSQSQQEKEEAAEGYRRALGKLNEQLEIGQTAYHREASRLESLRNMAERYDGYGSSIRKVMEKKEKTPGILGVVADIIKVDQKYETAVETALGGNIQNIVTDNEATAKELIAYLKKNKLGRATFLPLTGVESRDHFPRKEALDEAGAIGLASTLVQAEKQYEGVVSYLLGRVLVVQEIDAAIRIARKYRHSIHIVTLEGEYLSPGGSMTGGAFRNSSNLLGRRRELEELEENVKRLAAEMQEARSQMEAVKDERRRCREESEALNARLQEQFLLQNTARLNVNQSEQRLKEIAEGYAGLQREGILAHHLCAYIAISLDGGTHEARVSNALQHVVHGKHIDPLYPFLFHQVQQPRILHGDEPSSVSVGRCGQSALFLQIDLAFIVRGRRHLLLEEMHKLRIVPKVLLLLHEFNCGIVVFLAGHDKEMEPAAALRHHIHHVIHQALKDI